MIIEGRPRERVEVPRPGGGATEMLFEVLQELRVRERARAEFGLGLDRIDRLGRRSGAAGGEKGKSGPSTHGRHDRKPDLNGR